MSDTPVHVAVGAPIKQGQLSPKYLLAHAAIITLGLAMLYPVLWMISSAFKPAELIFSEPGLFPRQVIYGDLTHMTIFTPQTLAQLLRPCGFQDLRFFETGPIPLRLRGRLDVLLWRLVKSVANFVRYVETGKRQAIWTENFICLSTRR